MLLSIMRAPHYSYAYSANYAIATHASVYVFAFSEFERDIENLISTG
jgi:hypothetical protein